MRVAPRPRGVARIHTPPTPPRVHSATVRDFTIVANEPANGADPLDPFTEKEVQDMAVQLDKDDVIMESNGSIYSLEALFK